MSHSKYNKRGYSLYLEKWNQSAKKYINTCAICGKKGYSPVIEQEEFCCNRENKVIYKGLHKILNKMEIDTLGRCLDCARIHDKL